MLIAPQAYCAHDTECSTIVRVAIGLPAIAGGIGVGALVDSLMSRRSSPVSGLQVNWTFDSPRASAETFKVTVSPFLTLVTSAGRNTRGTCLEHAHAQYDPGRAFGQ